MSRRLLIFLALLAAAALWTHALRMKQGRPQDAADFGRVPARVGTRAGLDETFDARTMQQLRAHRVLGRVYRDPDDGSIVELFIAYFGSQETGSQIHSPQNCLPGSGWHILQRSAWVVPTRAGPRPINEFVITKGEGRQLVHYWFVTRSGIISNEFALKLDLVRNSLLGRHTDAAFIRLARPVGAEGLEAARGNLRTFCLSILPILDDAIPIAPRGSASRVHSEYTPRAESAMLSARLRSAGDRIGAQTGAGATGVAPRALHGRRGTVDARRPGGGIGRRAPVHAQSKLSERSGRRAAELMIVR